MEKLYTVEEASELLRVVPGTLRNWIYEGKIKAVKVNGRRLLRESAILEVIEEGQNG